VKCSDDKIGLCEKAVLALSESLVTGTVIYCDRYFTGVSLMSELLAKKLFC